MANPIHTINEFDRMLTTIEKSTQSNDIKVAQLDRLFEALVLNRSEFDGLFDISGATEEFAKHYEKVATKLYKGLGTIATLRFAHLTTKTVKLSDGGTKKVPFRFSLTREAILRVHNLTEMSPAAEARMLSGFQSLLPGFPAPTAPVLSTPIRYLPSTEIASTSAADSVDALAARLAALRK